MQFSCLTPPRIHSFNEVHIEFVPGPVDGHRKTEDEITQKF